MSILDHDLHTYVQLKLEKKKKKKKKKVMKKCWSLQFFSLFGNKRKISN